MHALMPLLVIGLAFGTIAAPVAQASPADCAPSPSGVGPKQVVDWATYVLFFWDPDLSDCA